jgi:hypothetical protein
MPVAPSIETLYDFEAAIETGFKNLFLAELEAVAVVTTSDKAATFSEHRPRIELECTVGGEAGHHRPALPYYRADAFTAQLIVTVVSNTRPDEVGTSEHSSFRASVRNLMAKAPTLLKANRDAANDMMPHHAVHDLVHSGSTPSYETEDGYFATSIQYDLKFGIQTDAWPVDS